MGNELGAAFVLIGADMNPLSVGLRNAQRVTNSAMAQMTTSVQQFGGAFGKAMKLGVGVGIAGGAVAFGGAALAVGNLLSQVEALTFFASEVGKAGGSMKQALPEFDAIHERLAKQLPLTRAAGLEIAAYGKRLGLAGNDLEKFITRSIGLATAFGVPFAKGGPLAESIRRGQDPGLASVGLPLPPNAPASQVTPAGEEFARVMYEATLAAVPLRPDKRIAAIAKDWAAAIGEAMVEGIADGLVGIKIPSSKEILDRLEATTPRDLVRRQVDVVRRHVIIAAVGAPAAFEGLKKRVLAVVGAFNVDRVALEIARFRSRKTFFDKPLLSPEGRKRIESFLGITPATLRDRSSTLDDIIDNISEASASGREQLFGIDNQGMQDRGGIMQPGLNTHQFDREIKRDEQTRQLIEVMKESVDLQRAANMIPAG